MTTHPTQYETLHSLGVIEGRRRNWSRAAELLARAAAANPHEAAVHCDRGVAQKALGEWQAALESYDRALALKPNYPEALSNRGNVLLELKHFDAALASYDEAIALKPNYAEAHYNRGRVLQLLNRLPEALASYDAAIAGKADYAWAHSNRGVVLEHLHRFEEALASYDRAIAVKPDYAQAYSNRANVQRSLLQPDAAVASCNRALALEPQHSMARLNRGIALLLAGDLDHGWPDYESRVEARSLVTDRRSFAQPRWLGEPLAGKTILIHAEQGLGDTLQFCRYARLVADQGAEVILEVQPPLARLLAPLEGVSRLVARGEPLPHFDCHSALLSLPLIFKTTLANIPACVPYLFSDLAKTDHWKQRLGETRALRVGLVWSGGFRPDQPEVWSVNERRNIGLVKLASLAHPRIEFHSLQKGQAAESELARLIADHWSGPPLTDFTGELYDFTDTAALMANLDLIISVDTSIAHLAGAMGKPVWILNRFDTCWRWLLNRSDSPWYPTATLYRQDKPGDWDCVVRRVRTDLLALIGEV